MELEVIRDEENKRVVVDKNGDIRFKAKYGSGPDGFAAYTLFYAGEEIDISVNINAGDGIDVQRYINFPKKLEDKREQILDITKLCFLKLAEYQTERTQVQHNVKFSIS